MSAIRRALAVAATATALALPAGCDEKDVDKAIKDAETEVEKGVDKAKKAEKDIQNDKDLP